MKLLIWNCSRLRYSDEAASNRPVGVHRSPPVPGNADYRDVLLVFVTVEDQDTPDRAVAAAVGEVLRTVEMVGQRTIVLMPFAHLSRRLAAPRVAREAIRSLAQELRLAGQEVNEASFGFHKGFELAYVAYGHPGSVAYREV